MNHLLCAAAVGLFALAAAPIFALSGSGDSEPFILDTRTNQPNSGFADSTPFVLDTRSAPLNSGFADSTPFVLDTRTSINAWVFR